METISITESSYSLASEDAETLVDSASRLSLDFSESATLRSFQLGTLPVSPSQETVRGAPRKQSRMAKAAHRFMSTLGRDRVKAQAIDAARDAKPMESNAVDLEGEGSSSDAPLSSLTSKALLSCMSSRHPLTSMAISLFLKRYDLDKPQTLRLDPSDQSFGIKVESPLSFRGIELLVTNQIHCLPPVRSLEIWIDANNIKDIKSLTAFVELLPSVKELWLRYYGDDPTGASPPVLIGDAARQARQLLSALSTKGCISFQSMEGYRVPSPSSPSGQTSKDVPKEEQPLPSTSRTAVSHKLESIDRFRPLNSLVHVTLASLFISIPLISEWTIESLNLSPICYLTILQSPSPSILPSLSLNALTSLSIHQVSYVDLLPFLSRHPSIGSLYIAGTTDVGPQSSLPPLPSDFTLPNLHILAARPELILHWLQNTNPSSALPFLQHFILQLNEVSEKVDDALKLMYVTLNQIRRLPKPATVWITIPSKALLLSLDGCGRSDVGANELPIDNLHFVALLFHQGFVPHLEFDDLKLIPQWVTTSFPSLNSFSLFHGILSKKTEDQFLKYMVGTCRGLETIEIKSWNSS
ncbi:hypothetical protein JAAARDRAFT_79591 [Jaapia argillacea MUCL 33604]|uniref:Uncharacterized protein n=1 Tax=Jaapia argillacea MUCL 33604 TaxID=933084 RepID=A0A067Q0P4_9AGAM|nr:hypothetical protein JAAARDRAFT_79591 [Jaapia argillacea MUCL 33604]